MNTENKEAPAGQAATEVHDEEFKNLLTIDRALQLGAFNLQVSCVRNPRNPDHSIYLAYLPARQHSQAISDAFEGLAIQDLESVLTQASVTSVLMLGAGFSYTRAIQSLQSALTNAGKKAKTEADRLRLLMVANDLLLTTTVHGVDVEEVLDPEEFMLDKWIIKNLAPADVDGAPKSATLGDMLAGKLEPATTDPTSVTPNQDTNK